MFKFNHFYHWSLLITILCAPLFSQSNNFDLSKFIGGIPKVTHFDMTDFAGDPDIMAMCEDAEGIKYFGNNDGVMIFDGARWYHVALPNQSFVKALHFSKKESKVYVGGFNELGNIVKNEYGEYEYHSLLNQIPVDERNLEVIWDIVEVKDHLLFRSLSKLVNVVKNRVSIIPAENFYFSTTINQELYLANWETGLLQLDLENMTFNKLVLKEAYDYSPIVAVLPTSKPDVLKIYTRSGHIYSLNIEDSSLTLLERLFPKNSDNQVNCAILTKEGSTYVGTLTNEILIITSEGKLITPNTGLLQNKAVTKLIESKDGNIWALLNNGIDCINLATNSAILLKGLSVFDVAFFNKRLYVATNQGVLESDTISAHNWSYNVSFHMLKDLEGQAWSLQIIDGHLICGHNKGVFDISHEKVKNIPGTDGVWKVLPIEDKKNHYLVCTYYQLYLMEYIPASSEFLIKWPIETFPESTRDIVQDGPGEFWVCHGFKGVFRIKINKAYDQIISVEHYNENGLPTPYKINVFKWNQNVVFTTSEGIFSYQPQTNQFEAHKSLNEIFGSDSSVRKLLKRDSTTWFVHNDQLGYFKNYSTADLHKAPFRELEGTFNKNMECIFPYGNSVLVGTKVGLFSFDMSKEHHFQEGEPPSVTRIITVNKGIQKLHPINSEEEIEFTSDQAQNLKFEFAAPAIKVPENVEYRYRLENESDWSSWSDRSQATLLNLKSGEHHLLIQSRNALGEITRPATYRFRVLTKWYFSIWAFGLYILLSLAILLVGRSLIKSKIKKEKEKTRLDEKRKQQSLELQIERMHLEQEKTRAEMAREQLEEDLIHKSKELANNTMLLVRKRELLINLEQELNELKTKTKGGKSLISLKKMQRQIAIHLKDDEHIRVFETNFERVHHEFFSELKTHYPDLSSKDLQLCALVKMNLSNKEIAPIMNISVRGVETARYRLRKRLSIHENMAEFLEKLSP